MEGGSEGESNKNAQHSPSDGQTKKPKRQMKTPFQLETLEKVYASMFVSENFVFFCWVWVCFVSKMGPLRCSGSLHIW